MNSSTVSIVEQVDRLLGAAMSVARLGDDALRDELVACEQAAQMLAAHQAQIMVQMGVRARAADRAEVVAGGDPMWSQQCRETYVPDEIGVLLGWTKMAAVARYDTACRVAGLPVVAAAWRAGRVDARKVAVIVEQLSHLHPGSDPATVTTGQVEALAADAVGYATVPGRSRTAPQLREWLRRKVIAADPGAAEVRRQQAMGDRRVVITPGEDGMSELWALLPSVQARQIQIALTSCAQQLGGSDAGDARTMDQRRADTMVDLLLGRTQPPAVNLQVIVPADTITGDSDQPGWVPGLGPVTATEVAELLRSGLGAQIGTDTSTGSGTGSGTGAGTGSEMGTPVSISAVADRPDHRDPDRPRREPLPAVSRAGPGRPRPGCDLPVPRLPPLRRQRRHRPRPHRALAARPHRSDQPCRLVPAAPPPQTHPRMERRTPPHRDHDLDHPHRTQIPHPTLAIHQPRPIPTNPDPPPREQR